MQLTVPRNLTAHDVFEYVTKVPHLLSLLERGVLLGTKEMEFLTEYLQWQLYEWDLQYDAHCMCAPPGEVFNPEWTNHINKLIRLTNYYDRSEGYYEPRSE